METALSKHVSRLALAAALAAGCVSAEPTVPDFPECAAPLVQCDDACVDVSIDALHCGSCETACDLRRGEACVDGSCRLECDSGTLACGDACVDTQTDAGHCGNCTTACDTKNGEVCASGSCTLACGGGSTDCNGACVNTANDPNHCGDCDTVCADGQVCSESACGLTCTGGSSLCSGTCVDFSSDPLHCGNCKTACDVKAGETCSDGACTTPCAGGTTRCGDACVDANIDPNHCGACDVTCGDHAACGGGQCACVDGYMGDGRTCTDVDECAGSNDCSPSGECLNTEGGYACRCRDSQSGDGRTCTGFELVSVASSGMSSAGESGAIAISADARYVAFVSTGGDFVTPSLVGAPSQVFLRDMVTHATSLVSVNDTGAVADDAMTYGLAMSRDGSRIAFGTKADNLDGGTAHQTNVFLRDTAQETTVLRSGVHSGDKLDSDMPSVSSDGSAVAFQSGVTLTKTKVTNQVVYLSTQPGKFALVSVSDAGAVPAADTSCGSDAPFGAELPSVSGDGTRVVFDTAGIGLTADEDTNCASDVFLRDLSDPAKPVTTLVSANVAGQACSSSADAAGSLDAVLSENGNFVAFDSTCYDLLATPDDTGQSEVFVRDLAKGTLTKVSVTASNGHGNGPSFSPQISADGRYVAFTSYASNLVTGDKNGQADVFVRDLVNKKTTRVDLGADGSELAAGVNAFAFASSGAAVAFSVYESLLPEDTTGSGQIYVRYLR
jgi:Tol biopolymer transport system component